MIVFYFGLVRPRSVDDMSALAQDMYVRVPEDRQNTASRQGENNLAVADVAKVLTAVDSYVIKRQEEGRGQFCWLAKGHRTSSNAWWQSIGIANLGRGGSQTEGRLPDFGIPIHPRRVAAPLE